MPRSQHNILALKEYIHDRIKQEGIDGQVRELIQDLQQKSITDKGPIEEQVLRSLKDKGVLKNLLNDIQIRKPLVTICEEHKLAGSEHEKESRKIGLLSKDTTVFTDLESKELCTIPSVKRNVKINPKHRYLHVKMSKGRAFLDYLVEESQSHKNGGASFIFHLCFRGQRFWTKPIVCTCEPEFNDSFFLELHNSALDSNRMADSGELLGMSDQIHIVLMKILPSGYKQLLSSVFVEWRYTLASPTSTRARFVELNGICAANSVPVGIIEIQCTLFPKLSQVISEKVVSAQIKLEKHRQMEKEKTFLVYAKKWWQEYTMMRPEYAKRTVKIFVQDENYKTKPVFNFINVLRIGRPLLETPRESAWFVALIPHENMEMLGATHNSDLWLNMHTFLCLKKGSSADHALLLCSLLLGFGLDAYVAIGTRHGNIPWSWVVTLNDSDYVTFWESTTGARYLHKNFGNLLTQEKFEPEYPYETVGCLFNNKYLYATIQPTDEVVYSSFAVQDELCWKTLTHTPPESVSEDTLCQFPVPLIPGWSDPVQVGLHLERELQTLITENRKDKELVTQWDSQLSHLIAPILSSYETQHKAGISAGIEEFVDMIHRNIPTGFGFRALPLQLTSLQPRQVLRECLRNSVLEEIINCSETDLKLGLRIHVYVYPEDVLSIWLILACKYRISV